MRQVVLTLIAVPQQPQMFLGPADVISDAAPDPLVIGMGADAVAHHLADYFQRILEWLWLNHFALLFAACVLVKVTPNRFGVGVVTFVARINFSRIASNQRNSSGYPPRTSSRHPSRRCVVYPRRGWRCFRGGGHQTLHPNFGLVVLRHPQGIVVSLGQVALEVTLDVVLLAQAVHDVDGAQSARALVDDLGDGRKIIGAPDFVEVDKLMRSLNHCQAMFDVEGRFK
jgi:hypothetical protein